MKKNGKWAAYIIILFILLLVVAASYIVLALPDVGKPEDITVKITPARIARGAYLANHVTICMDCHSQRDWSKPIGDIAAGKLGAGGDDFDNSVGIPGDIYIPNITPYKLKYWTDGEILRAITTGERKDGSAIYPFMPWPGFSHMSREDLYCIIAYLRSLKPIKTANYPKPRLDFPQNILEHLLPAKAVLGQMPPVNDSIAYGKYVIAAANCSLCHSQKNNGKIIAGMEYAGGIKFSIGKKIFTSANLTPDKNTGIGNWTEDAFVQRFKSAADTSGKENANGVSPMPWYDYGGMSATDLKAIYKYLRSIKPVNNKVINL